MSFPPPPPLLKSHLLRVAGTTASSDDFPAPSCIPNPLPPFPIHLSKTSICKYLQNTLRVPQKTPQNLFWQPNKGEKQQ